MAAEIVVLGIGVILAVAAPDSRMATLALLVLIAVIQLLGWGLFVFSPGRPVIGWVNFVEFFVPTLICALLAPIYYASKRLGNAVTIAVFANAALLLLLAFSRFYWTSGTTANFNTQLSRLDAFYFALGTLSTAGTGNIVATSELARSIQTLQMALDIVLLLFIAGLVVTRISESSSRRSMQAPESASDDHYRGEAG